MPGNKIQTWKAIDKKRPPLDTIMNQFNPIYILTAYCPKMQFKSFCLGFSIIISFHSSKTTTVKNHWTAVQARLENGFLFFLSLSPLLAPILADCGHLVCNIFICSNRPSLDCETENWKRVSSSHLGHYR